MSVAGAVAGSHSRADTPQSPRRQFPAGDRQRQGHGFKTLSCSKAATEETRGALLLLDQSLRHHPNGWQSYKTDIEVYV